MGGKGGHVLKKKNNKKNKGEKGKSLSNWEKKGRLFIDGNIPVQRGPGVTGNALKKKSSGAGKATRKLRQRGSGKEGDSGLEQSGSHGET